MVPRNHSNSVKGTLIDVLVLIIVTVICGTMLYNFYIIVGTFHAVVATFCVNIIVLQSPLNTFVLRSLFQGGAVKTESDDQILNKAYFDTAMQFLGAREGWTFLPFCFHSTLSVCFRQFILLRFVCHVYKTVEAFDFRFSSTFHTVAGYSEFRQERLKEEEERGFLERQREAHFCSSPKQRAHRVDKDDVSL